MPEPAQKLGTELRKARKRKGLSIRELAKAMSYAHSRLSDWELGKAVPPLAAVQLYEQVLGLTPGSLVQLLEQTFRELVDEDFPPGKTTAEKATGRALQGELGAEGPEHVMPGPDQEQPSGPSGNGDTDTGSAAPSAMTLTPQPRVGPPRAVSRARHLAERWTLVAAVIAAAIAALTTTRGAGGSDDPSALQPAPATTTAGGLDERSVCASGARTIRNHDSGGYINAADRPRMGPLRLATYVVVDTAPIASTECVASVRDSSKGEDETSCMDLDGVPSADATPTSGVVWRHCDNRVSQKWIIHYHWRSEGVVVYYHIRPVRAPDLCLQQDSKGGVGVALTVVPCGSGWLQQWVFEVG